MPRPAAALWSGKAISGVTRQEPGQHDISRQPADNLPSGRARRRWCVRPEGRPGNSRARRLLRRNQTAEPLASYAEMRSWRMPRGQPPSSIWTAPITATFPMGLRLW
jgi:hypothetical protein